MPYGPNSTKQYIRLNADYFLKLEDCDGDGNKILELQRPFKWQVPNFKDKFLYIVGRCKRFYVPLWIIARIPKKDTECETKLKQNKNYLRLLFYFVLFILFVSW